MSFGESVTVIQSGRRRVKIFVDFWNVVINARNQSKRFDLEMRWDELAAQIVSETRTGYHDQSSGELAGCYIFGSYSKSDPKESKFIERTLDSYGACAGLYFEFTERVKKQTADKCPSCGEQITRNSELGVDVLLAVEMIKHASMREHDYLALVSSDRDYIPLLSFLKDQGQRVLHVATGEPNPIMRSLTWAQMELVDRYPHICDMVHDGALILTAPQYREEATEAASIADAIGLKHEILDITDREVLPDKDLKFLIQNQNLHFKRKEKNDGAGFPWSQLFESIEDFRKSLRRGDLDCNLPHVVHESKMIAFRTVQLNGKRDWIINSNSPIAHRWREIIAPRGV